MIKVCYSSQFSEEKKHPANAARFLKNYPGAVERFAERSTLPLSSGSKATAFV
jgi:hypothetical protein